LVDEIENGIHYSVMPDVWKFVLKLAKRLGVQVFATTHSKDCYQTFQAATKGDQAVDGLLTRIERKKGELRASLFDEDRLKTVVNENIEIR
jgi:3-hydroxyisobutyrate dehydrogenase-like beta-hydroxyacid dehydrogenase